MDFGTILRIAEIIFVVRGCYVTIKHQIQKLQFDVKSIQGIVQKFLVTDVNKITNFIIAIKKETIKQRKEIHLIKKRLTRIENK